MGTYYIPRNLKGETRLLYIFTVKSLMTTGIGAILGLILYALIGGILGQKIPGLIAMGVCALVGWIFGAVKIPTVAGIPITKNIGGESLDEILRRYMKFKVKRKYYTYVNSNEDTKEENR